MNTISTRTLPPTSRRELNSRARAAGYGSCTGVVCDPNIPSSYLSHEAYGVSTPSGKFFRHMTHTYPGESYCHAETIAHLTLADAVRLGVGAK